ncbi:MAG TPA: type II toxin-antitoxin system VapC family toxin [Solirubrobacteraceae bacterium]|nr:type II toxin-antitoxin system VapC family toxin [Solirubrobacteraceae bacterium]
MKLPDVNLFVYAYDALAPQHERAKTWLEDALSGSETVAFAWVALLGFIRLTTSRQRFAAPWGPEQALEVVDSWLAQPMATVVHPTARHASVLRDLLAPLGTGGNLTTDAHLAALAMEHGATLCSHDNDFSRFPGLRWEDPLTA